MFFNETILNACIVVHVVSLRTTCCMKLCILVETTAFFVLNETMHSVVHSVVLNETTE